MKGTYKKDLIALAVLVGALIVLTFLFGDVPRAFTYALERTPTGTMVAQASGCEASGVVGDAVTFAISSAAHQSCKPPGPPSNGGRDGYTCQVPVPGGVVLGTCTAGCCTGPYGYPEADSFLSGLGEGLLQGIILGGANQLLSSFLGGTAGTGSYTSPTYYTGGDSGYLSDYGTLENFSDTSNLAWDIGDDYDGFTLDSGSYGDSTQSGGSLSGGSGNTSGGTTNPGTQQQTGTQQPADSVSTTYEYLKNLVTGGSSSGSEGLSSDGQVVVDSGLSLARLEQDAADAQRREAALNEQNANNNLGDYRSSGVSQSGQVNPLATQERATQEPDLGWWERFVLFVGKLFGSSGS